VSGVCRVSSVSALEAMARRKVLSARQMAAGRRLSASYNLGIVGLHQSTGCAAQMPPHYMDAKVSAATDYERAREAVGGRIWPVLWAVVCGDQTIHEISGERGLNPTAAMTTLKIALDMLADHYGLTEGP
jgi:hypothetical protein